MEFHIPLVWESSGVWVRTELCTQDLADMAETQVVQRRTTG